MSKTFEHCLLRNETWHPYHKFSMWVLTKYNIDSWVDFEIDVSRFINAELEKYKACAVTIPNAPRPHMQRVTFDNNDGFVMFMLEWGQTDNMSVDTTL